MVLIGIHHLLIVHLGPKVLSFPSVERGRFLYALFLGSPLLFVSLPLLQIVHELQVLISIHIEYALIHYIIDLAVHGVSLSIYVLSLLQLPFQLLIFGHLGVEIVLL